MNQAANIAPPIAPNTAAAAATTPPEPVFSLGRFESNCYARNHEPAAREFMALLGMLDRNYGALDPGFVAKPTANLGGTDQDPHIINRICSALSALFSDPSFNLSFEGFRQMLFLHRWIATLFAASSFKNADHILRALNLNGPDAEDVQIKSEHMVKFAMLFTPNSEIPVNLDALWAFNKNLCAALCCALVSPRFLGTQAAHSKRELILRWLPNRLDEIEDLDVLPVGILHDVYMHCSYADLPEKHAIKAPINRLIRKKLVQQGVFDVEFDTEAQKKRDKPVMMVILEWFSGAHAMYRCYGPAINAARKHFHTIGVGNTSIVDETGRSAFEEFIELDTTTLFNGTAHVRAIAQEKQPDIVYYPSIGMFPMTIFTSNLRLAPMQCMTFGHPATSLSPCIDYRLNEPGSAGDPRCFSEELILMPKSTLHFAKSSHYVELLPIYRENPDVVKIVVTASSMKFNPGFLLACREIEKNAKNPVEFHMMIGMSRGLVYLEARDFVKTFLPKAIIYPMEQYNRYLANINNCDMFLNPFPFGNTNGIIDVASQKLIGICLTGPETCACTDEVLFQRLGFPEWTIARTREGYINAALRLIDDHTLRISIRKEVADKKLFDNLFAGNPDKFGEVLERNIIEHEKKSIKVHCKDIALNQTDLICATQEWQVN